MYDTTFQQVSPRFVALSLFVLLRLTAQGQSDIISATTNMDPEYLIREVFLGGGDCFNAFNFQLSGSIGQAGVFTNGTASIGMETGIILSNGNVEGISGPNTSFNFATTLSTGYGNSSTDSDLLALSEFEGNNNPNFSDIVILEFDFTPTLDSISFDFVFASEEYCEFVLSSFIDLFGFFISGPGINGPYSNNGINIATVPSTNQPITAGTLNQFLTPQYYVNNIPPGNLGCSLNAPAAAADLFGFDGFTVPLTAAAAVIPCETYHLKLIVSDRGFDDKLDAAVFLRANSFAAGRTAQVSSDIDGVSIDGFPYEGCSTANITFSRGDNIVNNDLTVNYEVLASSTATPGLDYTALPDSIIIPAGQLSVTVPIQLFADGEDEGVEFFTLRLRNPCDCSQSSLTINIVDAPPLDVTIVGTDRICLGDGLDLAAIPVGGTGAISYIWPNGDVDSLFNVIPLADTTYQLMIEDECLNRDTAYFSVTVLSPRAELFGDVILCDGRVPASIGVALAGSASYDFGILSNGNLTPYSNIGTDTLWIPVTGTGTYQLVNFMGDGCAGAASGVAQSLAVDIQTSIQLDSVNCFGASDGRVAVLPVGGSGTYTYTWAHDAALATRFANSVASNTYAVTIEDSNGCLDAVSVYLPEPPPLEVAIDTLALVANCLDGGSLQASANGGTAPYAFLWSNGVGAARNDDLMAGSYLLTVRDVNDCLSNLAVEILADSLAPSVQLQAAAALDCTTTSVNIAATVSDMGTNPVYRWTDAGGAVLVPPGQPLQLPVSSAGTYFLTVENSDNGCTTTASVLVDDTSGNPTFTLAGITDLDCLQPTTTLTLGNLQPTWDITWLDANDTPLATQVDNYTITTPGSYAVVVSDPANGCTTRQTISIGGNLAVPVLTLVAAPTVLDCITPNTPIAMAASGGAGSYTFTWSGPVGGIVGDAQSPNITAQEPGTYTLIVEDQSNRCTDTLSATVIRDVGTLAIDPIADTLFTCAVNAISLTASSPNTGNLTYQWRAADGTVLANVPDVDIPAPGVYTVRVTDLDNNCFQTRSITVGIDTLAPTVQLLANDDLTCTRTSVQLSAQVGAAPLVPIWTDETGLEISTGSWATDVSSPGNYILTVTNTQNGCAAQAALTVEQDTVAPQISILLPEVLTCESTSVALVGQLSSAPGSITYRWTGTGISGSDTDLLAMATAPGGYTLSATNTDNGCATQVQTAVTQDTIAPVIGALADVVLDCYQPTATIDGTISTPTSVQYRWEDAAGTVLANTPSLTVSMAGTYSLLVVNTANGCESSRSVVATENRVLPTANAGDDAEITCDQTTAVLTGVSGPPTWTPTWLDANGNVVAAGSWTLATSLVGNYTLTVEDIANGCTATDAASVTQDQTVPTLDAGPDQILDCFTQAATLQGTPAAATGTTYTLLDAAGQVVGQSNTPVFTVSLAGTYQMVAYNPANDCTATDEVDVRAVVPAIDSVALADITCVVPMGSIVVETVSGGTAPYLYSIDAGATWQLGNAFGNLASGVYDIVVQDANGCEAERAATLLESGNITVLLPNQVTLLVGDTYLIRPEIDLDEADIASIQWSNTPQLDCADCLTPTFVADATELVAVTVTGANGCVGTAKILLIVDQRVPIYVPNAFSPHNGDGVNDAFTVFGDVTRVAEVVEMRIFDRWGNLVFNNKNFPINNPDEGWKGTQNGQPLNPAVFVYAIQVRLRNDEVVTLQGDVILVE